MRVPRVVFPWFYSLRNAEEQAGETSAGAFFHLFGSACVRAPGEKLSYCRLEQLTPYSLG